MTTSKLRLKLIQFCFACRAYALTVVLKELAWDDLQLKNSVTKYNRYKLFLRMVSWQEGKI